MRGLDKARETVMSLYGRETGPFSRISFVLDKEQKDLCRVSYQHDGVEIFSFVPNIGAPLGDRVQYVEDASRLRFENLADALERRREYSSLKLDVLGWAAREFWCCLVPDIFVQLTSSRELEVGGHMVCHRASLNIDAITDVKVACSFEALSFALALGYHKCLVELSDKRPTDETVNQHATALLQTWFDSGSRPCFQANRYTVTTAEA